MKTISRITTQKKRKDRFNIYLNDGNKETYGFSVDEAVLIEYRLRKGLELDDSMIVVLVEKDTLQKSYTLAINYLSYRMRTKKEIYDYLVKKEVESKHIPVIMDRLEKEKLIDDTSFADSFVRTRIHTSNKGPMLVKRELQEKGVSSAIATQAIEQYTYAVQFEKAQKWAEKKLKQSSKKSFQQQLQQVQGTLMQKGFSQDVIRDVLRGIEDEKDEDEEWSALVQQGEKLMRKHQAKLSGFDLQRKVKESLYRKGFTGDLINKFLDEHTDE